jgi:acetate kinase
MKKYLIINTGSTSKKYALYDNLKNIYVAHFENEGKDLIVTETLKDNKFKKTLNLKDYDNAVLKVVESLIEKNIIKSIKDIDAVGIRIVAPGDYFLENKLIDKKYLKFANEAVEKVPLHLKSALSEIENVKKYLGEKIKIFGISDSAFHSTIPIHKRLYGISKKDAVDFGLYMFGYHGISIQSVSSKAKKILGYLPKRTIVCHLGGGASVTALKNGKSINTSMGFTPLEGLIMATRVGDIDPGAVIYLSEKTKKDTKELNKYFNNECGLLGLSGKSSDLRELIDLEKNGCEDSKVALLAYVDRIKQYIGKMSADLGGVDLLILAGTVGERSFVIRKRICEGLSYLGIDLDETKNKKSVGVETDLSSKNSKVKILVIKTDEMEEIAKATDKLIG